MSRAQRSFLEQLYCGEVFPGQQILPKDPAYFPTVSAISDVIDDLSARLGEEDRARIDRLVDLMHESACMTDYANFAYGFRMGALITRELAALE